MNYIVTGDWHLTDNPLDEYKWDFCNKLIKYAGENEVQMLFIVGDLTENKDKHSSILVNRLTGVLSDLKLSLGQDIMILHGNHDSVGNGVSFFKFLDNSDAGIHFIDEFVQCYGWSFIPNRVRISDHIHEIEDSELVFLHNNIRGARRENTSVSNAGTDPRLFKNVRGKIYSGHYHTPQQVNNITFVGAPYPIDFNDRYEGRFIHNGKSISFPTIRKIIYRVDYRALDEIELFEGDQVKIEVSINRYDISQWEGIRASILEEAEKRKAIVVSLEMKTIKEDTEVLEVRKMSNTEVVKEYVTVNNLGRRYLEVAQDIMGE